MPKESAGAGTGSTVTARVLSWLDGLGLELPSPTKRRDGRAWQNRWARPDSSPDLRLAIVAVGVWAAALATICLGWWFAAAVLPLALVAAWALRRVRAAFGVGMSAVSIGVAVGAVVTLGPAASSQADPLATWVKDGRFASVEAVVRDDPLALRNGTRLLVSVNVERVKVGGSAVGGDWSGVVFMDDTEHARKLLPGQRVGLRGGLAPPHGVGLEAATLYAAGDPIERGEPPWWQTAAGDLRQRLRVLCERLPDESGGLLPGLAVGDRSTMVADVEEDFRATGMTHLLAVSGANVTIVCGGAVLVAASCRAGPRMRLLVGLATIVGFVILARPSPSVLRAGVMGGIGLTAIGRRRVASSVPILAAAVIILMVWDPSLAVNLGFALSVTACAGLMLLANRWISWWRSRGWPQWLASALAVPIAAQLAVTPLLAATVGEITPAAIPANIAAAVAVGPATVLTVLATVIAPLWSDFAWILVWLASWPATWIVTVARYGAQLPWGSFAWPTGPWPGVALAVLLAAAVWMLTRRWGRRLVLVVALGITVGVVPAQIWSGSWPPPGWIVVACDVGQGDAIVLTTGRPGNAIVIDTGPEPDVVDDCLTELGVRRVSLLVISHRHADHVGGIAGVYRHRRVDVLLGPADGSGPLKETAGTAAAQPEAGKAYKIGDTRLEVLSGQREFRGTRSDANNNSLVLRADTSGVSVLLPGDLETPAQQELVGQGAALNVDVLKVPHHGSRHFDGEFFARASPAVAVVSVGTGNDYGHPHKSTLRRLRHLGTVVARTDRDGSTAIMATKEGLGVASR